MMADSARADAGPAEAEQVAAFAFGSRLLSCPTFNEPGVNYTVVHHDSPEAVQYDPARGWGYEVLYPADSPYGDRGRYVCLGPSMTRPTIGTRSVMIIQKSSTIPS